ncbi:MAG: diphthamide biosynthesis enzyme Dph2 [Nitrososphaerales archaeon]
MRIDEQKIFSVIRERRPKVVAFNGPEGIMRKIQEAANHVSSEFGIEAYVIGDACYGSCDVNFHAAEMVRADILFHIGHTISMQDFGSKIVMVDAYDDISFDSVAEKCAVELKAINYKYVSIVTDSQHLHQLGKVKDILEQNGLRVTLGEGKGQLNDGQVFGCEFYPAFDLKDAVDAYIFLGQSSFHAAGVALSTGRPTFILDPYYDEVRDVTKLASDLQKRSILAVYRALDARTIGLVVGLKEGQFMLNRVTELRKKLEGYGRHVQLIAMTEITDERLQVFSNIDAFIQVACPRISIDNSFSKPVLSVPQANALLRLLEKGELGDFLEIPHWL